MSTATTNFSAGLASCARVVEAATTRLIWDAYANVIVCCRCLCSNPYRRPCLPAYPCCCAAFLLQQQKQQQCTCKSGRFQSRPMAARLLCTKRTCFSASCLRSFLRGFGDPCENEMPLLLCLPSCFCFCFFIPR